MKPITDKQRIDFLEFLLLRSNNNIGGGGFDVGYDAGAFFGDGKGGEDKERSYADKGNPIKMFTVRTQWIRGKTFRELVDKTILTNPTRRHEKWAKGFEIFDPPTEKGE